MQEFYLQSLIDSLPLFFKGWFITLQLSALSLFLSTLGGLVLGVLKYLRIPVVKYIIAGYVDIVRGTPFLVQIFIIFFILFFLLL